METRSSSSTNTARDTMQIGKGEQASKAGMLDNNTYNLMEQLAEESKSLWRIRDQYKKDAGGCNECMEFWNKLQQDKENHVRDLTRLLQEHMR